MKFIIAFGLYLIHIHCYYCRNETYYGNPKYCLGVQKPCGQNGGWIICVCTDDCKSINNICVNTTVQQLKPLSKITYPDLCYYTKELANTDANCNYYGNGTKCPTGCLNNNKKNLCESINQSTCKSYSDWGCPQGCTLNNHECIPNSNSNVCKFIKKTLTCPFGCKYNSEFNKCISFDPNYICDLEKKLMCPQFCKLNIRGDTCVPIGEYIGNEGRVFICDRLNIPICPNGCHLNIKLNICEPNGYTNNILKICEPIVTLTCQHGDFSVNVDTDCKNDQSKICNYYGQLRYPLRLQKIYSNIMCEWSFQENCQNKRIKMTCC